MPPIRVIPRLIMAMIALSLLVREVIITLRMTKIKVVQFRKLPVPFRRASRWGRSPPSRKERRFNPACPGVPPSPVHALVAEGRLIRRRSRHPFIFDIPDRQNS